MNNSEIFPAIPIANERTVNSMDSSSILQVLRMSYAVTSLSLKLRVRDTVRYIYIIYIHIYFFN